MANEEVTREEIAAVVMPVIASVCSDGNSDCARVATDIASAILPFLVASQARPKEAAPSVAEGWAAVRKALSHAKIDYPDIISYVRNREGTPYGLLQTQKLIDEALAALASAPAPSPDGLPTLCTFGPPQERKRYWILKFEDADMADMHFTDEAEAVAAFEKRSTAWNCTLFVTAAVPSPAPSPDNGWLPIESAPKDGIEILALQPCYGHYNDIGKLRGYLPFIVSWARNNEGDGFWTTGGLGKKEPVYWQPIPLPPPPAQGGGK